MDTLLAMNIADSARRGQCGFFDHLREIFESIGAADVSRENSSLVARR
jgi:hypothetical protein